MSRIGAGPGAAVPVSSARAEASRRNGAKSRGPKSPEGRERAARNALKHGMRAQQRVLLPQEDAAAFAALEAALMAKLAPVGALQTLLARRVAVAAWRMERADRMEAEALDVRSYDGASPGVALIRDGNGTRALETLLRYRGAAMAEFMRALRTLKALQAEQAAGAQVDMPPSQPRAPARRASPRRRTNPSAFPADEPSAASNTSCPIHPCAVPACTRPQRHGCRTNPGPRARCRRRRPCRAEDGERGRVLRPPAPLTPSAADGAGARRIAPGR